MDLSSLLENQLNQQLNAGLMDQLSQQLGGTDRRETSIASSAILSTLMGALARNASTPDGAGSLAKALERDHDGSLLDNIGAIFGNSRSAAPPQVSPRTVNGGRIIDHILGEQREDTVREVSKTSGLSMDKVGSLMVTLAPILMGMLGKAKRERNIDSGSLGGILTDLVKGNQQQRRAPDLGLAGRMLDRDGDGSIIDDIAGMGSKMLGGFFNRR